MTYTIDPPTVEEYSDYHVGYIQRVTENDVVAQLKNQIEQLQQLLHGLSETNTLFRPAPEEWSIKQVIGHLIDCERVFVYRACSISRNDPAHLPGFDQDDYVRETNYDARPFADLMHEWTALRQATVYTFGAITPEISLRRGIMNDAPLSVRALFYITAGHTYHHLDSFQSDYLAKLR